MNTGLVILAAGWGSRYGGLKQIDSFGPNGESLLDYAVFDARQAGFSDLFLVIRPDMINMVLKKFNSPLFDKINCHYIIQDPSDLPKGYNSFLRKAPWGTAHALYACRKKVNMPFALINADDFYGAGSFKILASFLHDQKYDDSVYSLVGFRLKHSLSKNGSVSRGICKISESENWLDNINETFGLQKNQQNIILDLKNVNYSGEEFISMNCWGFKTSIFKHLEKNFVRFLEETKDIIKEEFGLPSFIMQMLLDDACKIKIFPTENKPFGITYRPDKALIMQELELMHQKNEYPNIAQNFVKAKQL